MSVGAHLSISLVKNLSEGRGPALMFFLRINNFDMTSPLAFLLHCRCIFCVQSIEKKLFLSLTYQLSIPVNRKWDFTTASVTTFCGVSRPAGGSNRIETKTGKPRRHI